MVTVCDLKPAVSVEGVDWGLRRLRTKTTNATLKKFCKEVGGRCGAKRLKLKGLGRPAELAQLADTLCLDRCTV